MWTRELVFIEALPADSCRRRPARSIRHGITAATATIPISPVIRGTRLALEFVIGLLADGWTGAEIIANYPGVAHKTSSPASPMRATS